MAAVDYSVHSKEPTVATMTSAQQPPPDYTDNPGAHHLTSLQDLKSAEHSQGEAHVSQDQNDGNIMPMHLLKAFQFPDPKLPVRGPEDQAEFASIEELCPKQFVEESVHVPRSQTLARSANTRNSITHQHAEASMNASSSRPLDGSASDQDYNSQQFTQNFKSMQLFQPQVGSHPSHNNQPAPTLMNTLCSQPHLGSQQNQEDSNHHSHRMFMDTHHPAQPQIVSYQNGNIYNSPVPRMTRNVHSFQPQIGSRQNQQPCNLQLPPMPAHTSRLQIDYQESHDRDLAHSSVETPRLQPQVGFREVQEAYNSQLAHMFTDTPQQQLLTEFPQSHDASIRKVDQMLMEMPPSNSQVDLLRGPDVHDRQLNQVPRSVRQPRERMESPRTQEAFHRQMDVLAVSDLQSDWQNGLQAGPRSPFWDQYPQNFRSSQHIQFQQPAQNVPSTSSTSTTSSPQLHLGPGGYLPAQQHGAQEGWPRSSHEGTRAGSLLTYPNPQKYELLSQLMPQIYGQPAVRQPIQNRGHLHQPQMLPAPTALSRMRPAAMHMPPPAFEPSGSLPPTQLSSDVVHKATFDDLRATRQPPIGTPRASRPKLITANIGQAIGQGKQAVGGLTLPLLPYHPGSDVMYPYARGDPSEALRVLTANGRPSIDKLIDKDIVPFVKSNGEIGAADWGVIRIGNIPYSLTRAEVLSFLGCDAQVIPLALGIGVHIIMERTTAKTMDCYVEFVSVHEAQVTVNQLVYRGRPLRLGKPPHDRVVTVALSSQDELMKELFPRAKNVVWTGGKPVIQASNEPFNTGFKAFITGEELVMMSKHAEQPHRSSYTQRCPQRTYECMISTLAKFPWYAVEHYTLGNREQIFNTTRDMLKHLVSFLRRGGLPNVDYNLLLELMITGLNANGFSESQRWELVRAAEYTGQEVRISPLAQWWPWEALNRKAGTEEDVVKYYAHLITLHPSLQEKSTTAHGWPLNPFGGSVEHDSFDITMAEAGAKEWELLQAILRDVLRETQRE